MSVQDEKLQNIFRFAKLAESRRESLGQSPFSIGLATCVSRGREDEALDMLCALPEDDYVDAVNEVDRNGSGILHAVAWHDRRKVCRRILEMRADPNLRNIRRNTPLHLACEKGNKALCTLLIQHGADLGLKDLEGLTPIDKIASEKERKKESKRLYQMQEAWKDAILDKMLSTKLKPDLKKELLEVFSFMDEEIDGRKDDAINVETIDSYLRMDFGIAHKGVDLDAKELQEFYESLVGNNHEYLRPTSFIKAVLAANIKEVNEVVEVPPAKKGSISLLDAESKQDLSLQHSPTSG